MPRRVYNRRPSSEPTLLPKPTDTPHPDEQLPAALRWATRLFSSWWVFGGLVALVLIYLASSLLPVGGRFLWQASWIDTSQQQMLAWQPFHLVLMLLGCVTLWTAVRRVPWRLRNLGLFCAAIGFAALLLGLSVMWRFQTHGLLATQPPDAEPLPLQTRYLDPFERVLFVQMGQSPPQQVPLDGLPLWTNPAQGSLAIPLHTEPGLRSQLDYRAQVHVVEYITRGRLKQIESADFPTRETPVFEVLLHGEYPRVGCPTDALLALRFTANNADGPGGETVVWLAFDLAAGQRVIPPQSYDIPGLGEVRLAFTLGNRDLGFAVAAEPDGRGAVSVRVVDTDPVTRQVIPPLERTLAVGESLRYEPTSPQPTLKTAKLTVGPPINGEHSQWVVVSSRPGWLLVYIGAIVLGVGLLLWQLMRVLTKMRNPDAND